MYLKTTSYKSTFKKNIILIRTVSSLVLSFGFLTNSLLCQIDEEEPIVLKEPKINKYLERAIINQFNIDYFMFRGFHAPSKQGFLPYKHPLPLLATLLKNKVLFNVKINPIEEFEGIKLKNFCLVEIKNKYRYINDAKDTLELEMGDQFFPYSSKFLVRYETYQNRPPYLVELSHVSGNINLHDLYFWLYDIFFEKYNKIPDCREPKDAEIFLKFRLFAFNSSTPIWDSLGAHNFPYYSFFIANCELAENGPCEARVYYAEMGERAPVDLIYYTKKPPNYYIDYNPGAIYEVKWPMKIIGREYEDYSQSYRVLPSDELDQLIDDGKFAKYFHKN